MRVIPVDAEQTVVVDGGGFVPSNVQNLGPGSVLIEGETVDAGGFYATLNGQRSFVVTTFDTATKVSVNV